MTLLIDLAVVVLLAGSVALGAVLRLRRMMVVAVLAVPAAVAVLFLLASLPAPIMLISYESSGVLIIVFLVIVFLSLLLLLRLRPKGSRRAYTVKSVLLRLPAVLLFGAFPVFVILAAGDSEEPDNWPLRVALLLLVAVLNVGAQLLVRVLQDWREREPLSFRGIGSRSLAGALGLGISLLALSRFVPALCIGEVALPAAGMPFNDDESRVYESAIVAPPELITAIVNSTLARRFLDPGVQAEAGLIHSRMRRYGEPIRRGVLPVSPVRGFEPVWDGQMDVTTFVAAAPARLTAGAPHSLVVRDSTGFDVLRFRDTAWTTACNHLPFVNPYARTAGGRQAWCVGDIDGDGADEILAGDSSRLIVFKWQGSGFTRRVYEFRYQIDNLVVGDINNDGRNEVVLSASDEKFVDGFERERICVARLTDAGLDILWNDRGVLALGDNRVRPADQLLAVADVENRGVNELLVHRPGNGDYQLPATYQLLEWRQGELRLRRAFSIVNDRLMTPDRAAATAEAERAGSDAEGAPAVGMVNGITVCLASTFEGSGGMPVVLFVLQPNGVRVQGCLQPFYPDRPGWQLRQYRPHGPFDPATQVFVMDPDGRGTAVLRILGGSANPVGYALDRLRPAAP